MLIDIITIFPGMFQGPFDESILKKAKEKGILEINIHNLRDFTEDKHQTVDDYPYGGGAGMVMKPEPIFRAVEQILEPRTKKPRIVLMCPQGEVFNQEKAKELAQEEHLLFLCGHYEGIDERVRDYLITDELSIGDYVLTGGELPAMVIVDSVARMIPGVVKELESTQQDSFYAGLLDYPHYTRPPEFRGWKVPEVLLSGHHGKIAAWRRKESLKRTYQRRKDLLEKAYLSKDDNKVLQEIREELEKS